MVCPLVLRKSLFVPLGWEGGLEKERGIGGFRLGWKYNIILEFFLLLQNVHFVNPPY